MGPNLNGQARYVSVHIFMPRRRVQLDGVPLHIAKRGHNREARFFTKDNYARYLRWLHEASGIGYQSWSSMPEELPL